MPPSVPSVNGPEDTSNFDSFDPKEEDTFATSSKRPHGFTGKSLPFVGFTFTHYPSPLQMTNSRYVGGIYHSILLSLCVCVCVCSVPSELVQDLKSALEVCQQECSSARDKHSTLERECVIYKRQLEV